ncbi:MAG: spore coat protein CotH [Ignavibacteriales bacterium CG_4_9_14_3_um_filter_34_10]|nr:MAG: spore coat protein CotH [Ignavibacteriales bacterium CG_4_9_14_3_um_filter_34_10]
MKINFKILILVLIFNNAVFPQVNLTSSNLPIFVINTHGQNIPDEPKITVDLGIIYNGEGVRNNITDPFNHYNGKIQIEIRGSSSQLYPKKSYAVQTVDAFGISMNTSLLELPKENDWVFYGPYADKSLIRNIVSYKLFNEMGHYASRSKLFELVINGEYKGVYVLLEKIKRDKNRVDIAKLTPQDIEGDELTGGYIVKIDKVNGTETEGWYSDFPPYTDAWQKILYQYHYPDEDEITLEQKNYIINKINEFESVMYSPTFNEPFGGYYDLIGLDSFADVFLITELSRNVDGYRLSAFMHKDKNSNGGKLKCGPIWDYNFTFGNADYYSAWSTSGWHLYTEFRDDPFQIPFWWKKLMMDKIFTNRIARRWADLRQNIFSNQHILGMTDSLSSLLAESQVRNFNKWKILGTYVWPNYFIGNTFELEINYLKSWVNYRLNWLDSIIPKDFSYVNWKDNDEFIINIEPNSSVDILVSDFYKETVNVDHFTVVVNNPEITASFINNAIHIESGNAGEFGIKLVGWKGNEKRELSQTYKVLVGISDVDDGKVPIDFSLSQNYPNPFNPSTTISFTIPSSTEYYSVLQNVTLKVYDILGREVATLVDENKPAGVYNVKCIMNNVNSAIYFYTLKAGSFFQTKKMMLIK